MESLNPIALAIPFFFLLIAVEWFVSWAKGRKVYRLADAITDLSCGIGEQTTGVFLKVIGLAVYTWAYQYRLLELPGIAAWILGFFLFDVAYYWWHRLSHEVNALWAIHVVHHQSEDYNLAVALRQTWFAKISGIPFYLPLALVGIPPHVYLLHGAISLLYQFWIHTELIGKLGPLEWVMNTPSHHRVHHGRNPEYLDKNYAAILIIWDRMFGTFEEEKAPVVYGTVKGFHSWNPIWANFEYWVYMAREAAATQNLADKLRIWVMGPGWRGADRPQYPPAPEVHPDHFEKWDTEPSRAIQWYVALNFIPVAIAVTGLLLIEKTTGWTELGVIAALILLTTWVWGGLFEGRRWAWPAEAVRLVGIVVAVVYFAPV